MKIERKMGFLDSLSTDDEEENSKRIFMILQLIRRKGKALDNKREENKFLVCGT